ncbi:permease [Nitrosophilus kaiyonis]|uniref:permease n=1 Tax=Nitrosophilus kaiyonis TaxID=2930200 RepID=UPI00248FC3BD|nr:permease [Nitrosophilus kaiyonis]
MRFLNKLIDSFKNFFKISPMILAVIGLIGIFKVFITPDILSSLFTKNPILDTFIGLFTGAIAVGQALISYILGGELLNSGISLYGVTAFILAWVTLGIVQLPLEASVLGAKFTVFRNILALIFTFLITLATVWTLKFLQ